MTTLKVRAKRRFQSQPGGRVDYYPAAWHQAEAWHRMTGRRTITPADRANLAQLGIDVVEEDAG